jgi:hypothetical protein
MKLDTCGFYYSTLSLLNLSAMLLNRTYEPTGIPCAQLVPYDAINRNKVDVLKPVG